MRCETDLESECASQALQDLQHAESCLNWRLDIQWFRDGCVVTAIAAGQWLWLLGGLELLVDRFVVGVLLLAVYAAGLATCVAGQLRLRFNRYLSRAELYNHQECCELHREVKRLGGWDAVLSQYKTTRQDLAVDLATGSADAVRGTCLGRETSLHTEADHERNHTDGGR